MILDMQQSIFDDLWEWMGGDSQEDIDTCIDPHQCIFDALR